VILSWLLRDNGPLRCGIQMRACGERLAAGNPKFLFPSP